jgi:hypothetical protein
MLAHSELRPRPVHAHAGPSWRMNTLPIVVERLMTLEYDEVPEI